MTERPFRLHARTTSRRIISLGVTGVRGGESIVGKNAYLVESIRSPVTFKMKPKSRRDLLRHHDERAQRAPLLT